jgi:hypothetical protein
MECRGVGFPRYAVGGLTPSVWGGLLLPSRPARHLILFCFPCAYYKTSTTGIQLFFARILGREAARAAMEDLPQRDAGCFGGVLIGLL